MVRREELSTASPARFSSGLRSAVTRSILGLVLLAVLLLLSKSGHATPAVDDAASARHPLASHAIPPFITSPNSTDVLLVLMACVLVGAVLAAGVFFFWLHSLPERMVHNSTKVHFDIVAVLGLLSLFTHIHLFWVVALLLALVRIPNFSMPDFSGLLGRIADALEKNSAGADTKMPKARSRPAE